MALEKGLCFQGGDPNGTRTRVFAVKGNLSLESTVRPAFHVSFRPLYINGLRPQGDEMSSKSDHFKAKAHGGKSRLLRDFYAFCVSAAWRTSDEGGGVAGKGAKL